MRKMVNKLKMVTSHNNINSSEEIEGRHLYLFYSMFKQPKNIFQEFKLLTKLIVMGQDPGPLEGIQNLQQLEEVWIIDASLKQESIGPICECVGVKRLYLYGNQLTVIPNLTRMNRLAHLWLSDNKITSLQNINSLVEVKELYLSNNNISEINTKIRSTSKIVCLNLSGNPISNMKEVPKLIKLRKLRWLIFTDPLYKPSPVSLLANFRSFVIHSLPELESLDMVNISESERSAAEALYESKLQYYRVLYHNSLSRNFSAQKSTYESKKREFELIWSALHSHGPLNNETAGEKNSKLKFWQAESKRWKERKQQCLDHYKKFSQVNKERIQLELEHSGNIRFIEVNLKDDTVKNHFKSKMDSFICPYLKEKAGEVHLLNVWSVQGPYRTTILQSQFKDSWDDVFVMKPVQDLSVALFQFVEELLFETNVARELFVANCFTGADPVVSDCCVVHRQLLLRSLAVLDSRVLLLCGVAGGALLCQSEQAKLYPRHSPDCCLLPLPDFTDVVPLYLVHYQYVFQDYFKPLKECAVAVAEPVDTALSEISRHCSLAATRNITELVISNNNIHKLDIPVMEHVTVVDLSYNHLRELSSIGGAFPNLNSLDLTFNRLSSLDSLQDMKGLTQLVVKWNFLTDFQSSLKKLKEFRSLKHLDLSWNPFSDVVCHEKKRYLVCHHLKSLLSLNGCSLLCPLVLEQVQLLERDQFLTVPAWRGPPNCLTLKWRAEMSDDNVGNHFGAVANHIVSATLQGIKLTQFSLSFSLKRLRWLDLSHNLINSASVLKGLHTLEEVNLSNNVMESFSNPSDKFKHLTKMNLSHNYILMLDNFRPQCFPNLKFLDLSNNCIESLTGMCGAKSLEELYLSHNKLADCETLINCKTWPELSVLDLSYNPLAQSNTLRQNCLYYINSLKYINGSRVQEGELKSAMALYGGLLDNNYLVKVYSKPTLANLTHLNLTKCSIKQVSLPDASLNNVTSMVLDHNKISSLSWVEVFPNLTRLSMSHNRVRSYSEVVPLSSSHRLQSTLSRTFQPSNSLNCLILDHNSIRNLHTLRLNLFPQLKLLVLNDNKISALSGLKKNCQLEQLVLDRNNLSCISIDHTSKLVKLAELYLEHNCLTTLEFLCPLKKLRKLFVGFNKLLDKSCLDLLSELPELKELTIHGNPLLRRIRSYRDCLPALPSLQLLEGHPVNNYNC